MSDAHGRMPSVSDGFGTDFASFVSAAPVVGLVRVLDWLVLGLGAVSLLGSTSAKFREHFSIEQTRPWQK